MKKAFFIATIFIMTLQFSWGQTDGEIRIGPTDQIVCPNGSITYRLEKYNSYLSTWQSFTPTGNWTVTGGTTNGYIGGLAQITVTWNDGVEQGTIKAEWTENNVTSSRVLSVTINSISHKTPTAILPTSSIQMGGE